MESFTFMSALLLCSLSWISVSGSESHTVEVQPGQEVTLLCDNISRNPTQTDWFRVVNRTKPHCIASTYGLNSAASFCDGFHEEKFEMSSNISTISLKIKQVDLSDSGLYFCGFYLNVHTAIGNATYLNVRGDADFDGVDSSTKIKDGMTNLMSLILGALTVLLMVIIIVLAVKIKKLQNAVNGQAQPERNEDLDPAELNYAALSFQAKPKRSRRPPPAREPEPHVVYAATR